MKARPFIMTLRDHFAEQVESALGPSPLANNGSSSVAENNTDPWTRQYIDVKYLQPIMDAIDDDGSAYVTIAEVNRFTEQLPNSLGWK